MKWQPALFFLIPILNIILNTLASKTAKESEDFISAMTSPSFFLTILIGTSSVICMITLYRSGIPLPKGILLMGAMSILIGSLWGIWHSKVNFTTVEWLLYASILIFMAMRFVEFLKTEK
ncbi:hypothetical protein ACPJXG_12370 [Janthinobacterium sp. NFX145]|uniref:hypothetical protein n=1 Tax=Janthinobacterium sp. NFX145 TaxID=3415602 RepID=UPI003CC51F89